MMPPPITSAFMLLLLRIIFKCSEHDAPQTKPTKLFQIPISTLQHLEPMRIRIVVFNDDGVVACHNRPTFDAGYNRRFAANRRFRFDAANELRTDNAFMDKD